MFTMIINYVLDELLTTKHNKIIDCMFFKDDILMAIKTTNYTTDYVKICDFFGDFGLRINHKKTHIFKLHKNM